MFSLKIILLCLGLISATVSHSFEEKRLVSAPVLDFPQEYYQVEHQPVVYNKFFHFFSAPEEVESYDEVIPQGLLRKNIRVVVIKAPENKRITTAIARLAKTLAEEKTAIYVLNKEPDLSELTYQIDKLKEIKTEKPEVHFVKYKTPEEAQLAAINIQSQYESLSGPSEVNKEEAAPLHSVVGSLGTAPLVSLTGSSDSIALSSAATLGDGPLFVSIPLNDASKPVELAATASPVITPTLNNLIVSTTLSPQVDVNISPASVNGIYLPPKNLEISSAKYLPPDSVTLTKKRETKAKSEEHKRSRVRISKKVK